MPSRHDWPHFPLQWAHIPDDDNVGIAEATKLCQSLWMVDVEASILVQAVVGSPEHDLDSYRGGEVGGNAGGGAEGGDASFRLENNEKNRWLIHFYEYISFTFYYIDLYLHC